MNTEHFFYPPWFKAKWYKKKTDTTTSISEVKVIHMSRQQ